MNPLPLNFTSICLIFLLSVFIQPLLNVSVFLLLFIYFFCFSIALLIPTTNTKKLALIISLVCFGNLYPTFFKTEPFPTDLQSKPNTYQGVVVSAPETKQRHRQAIFKLYHPIKQIVLLQTPPQFNLFYGQKLSVLGVPSIPPKFNKFDYAQYLKRHNISAILRTKTPPQIHRKNQGNAFIYVAQKSRQSIQNNLEKILPPDEATVATGMLLGVKKPLSKKRETAFRNAGLTHLLVVSGSNVSLLIILISMFLSPLGRPITFIGISLSMLFFIGMTGADPPIIRASIMGGLIAFAPLCGRLPDYKNILLLSACLIALENPRIIQQDIGFFLSFSATAGILLLSPILTYYTTKIANPFVQKIFVLLSITTAAQIFVFPTSLYFFQSFPSAGLISNLLSEPLVPFITIGAILSNALSILPITIAKILAMPVYIAIQILFFIAEIFSKIPSISLSKSTATALIVIQFCLAVYLLFSKKIDQKFYQHNTQFY